MEIGHNVLHGQWDWMNDPQIHSSTWDWDTASTSEAWKHSHNYVHHTYTNIRGKDKDLGYEIMRIDPHQKWNPVYLSQPFYNVLLVALLRVGRRRPRPRPRGDPQGREVKGRVVRQLKGMGEKAGPGHQGLHRLAAAQRPRGGRRRRRADAARQGADDVEVPRADVGHQAPAARGAQGQGPPRARNTWRRSPGPPGARGTSRR